MLSAHVWLIVAVFVPYLALMVGLGYYIWKSGQPRHTDRPAVEEDDPGPAVVRTAT